MTTTTRVPCFFAMAVEGRIASEVAIAIGPHAQTRGRETRETCRTPFSVELCRLLETLFVLVGCCGGWSLCYAAIWI
jgi:hypothetical protein